jgi:hypothetical protein
VREKYCWLIAGCWFVLREKYCWLVADKPNEQGEPIYAKVAWQSPSSILRFNNKRGRESIF